MDFIDPLQYFANIFPFEKKKIKRYAIGEKYVGIMLNNGHIGVCSTLQNTVEDALMTDGILSLETLSHRIIYNAYVNAVVNYKNTCLQFFCKI